jgi:hypothetical protein
MRKMTNCLPILLLAGVFALAGCGKSSKPQPSADAAVMDMRQLQQAFPSPSNEVQSSLDKVRMAIRYRQVEVVLAELDKLANNASLTEPQKKAVNDKIEQVKQAISAAAAAKPAQ